MSSRVSSPVLVGRASELAILLDAWSAAEAGRPSMVLVGGEAGIGKSRLVAELARTVRDGGGTVLEGACVSLGDDEGLPLAPIADALRALVRQLEPEDVQAVVGSAGSALGRLVPELGGTIDTSEAATRPDWVLARMLEAVLGVLHRLGEREPVLLVVEDLHWADRSTRDVLSFIARTSRTERLLVVGTYRTDEIHRRHPIRPWLAEMERTTRVDRLILSGLGSAPLAELVEAIRAVPPDPSLVRTIANRSEGNPFYVEELLAAGATESEETLPSDLREVLLSRVAALPDEVGGLLGIAAVAGRSVEHDLLGEVAAIEDEALEGAIREASAAGIVVAMEQGSTAVYQFRHALLQEAVYDDLLPTERRRYHATYAQAIQARPVASGAAGASQLAALAHHASASHDLPRALEAWIAAARASAEAYAFPAAGRSLERALDLWDAVPPDDRPSNVDQIDLFYELAFARMLTGDVAASVDAARRAVELCDPAAEPARAATLLERLGRASWVQGDFDGALRHHAEAVSLLEGAEPSPSKARVLSGYGSMLLLRGLYRRSIELSQEAIGVAREVGNEHAELYALNTLCVAVAQLGDCAAGIEIGRSAFERTKRQNDLHDLGRSYGNVSTLLQICGRTEEAAELAGEGAEWAERNGVWRTYGAFHAGNRASALVDLGRWTEARDLLAATREKAPQGVAILNHAINTGTLAVRMGDLELAHSVLDDTSGRAAMFRDAQFTGPLFVGLVELAIAEGRTEDAWATASEGIVRLVETDDALLLTALYAAAARAAADRALAADAVHDGAERDSAISDANRMATDSAEVVRPMDASSPIAREPIGYAKFAAAEAARARGAGAVEAWVAAGDHWAAMGRPWFTGYARYREAEALLVAGGDRANAVIALGEAREIAEQLVAVPLREEIDALARRARLAMAARTVEHEPAVADGEASRTGRDVAAPDPFALTAREREVLALVAVGQTNRRIAEALFISESTAGVHVSNILGKLGVASRTEAAAVAVRLGLAD